MQNTECDRSFTRSDALAKHMRTVHETEALRPSDPVPRNYSSAHFKPQRLKLIVNSKPPNASQDTEVDDDATLSPPPEEETLPPFEYPPDVTFSDAELSMRPDKLFRLLRRQVAWSKTEGKALEAEVQALEKKKRDEWTAKELVLANLMEAELAVGHANGESESRIMQILTEDLPGEPLPLVGVEMPWYRHTEDAPVTAHPEAVETS